MKEKTLVIEKKRKVYKELNIYNNSISPSDPTGSLDDFNFFGDVF